MSTAVPVKQRGSVLWWPLRGAWWFVTKACNRTGIVGGLVLGVLCMLLGYVLTASIVLALLGIPVFLFGLLLTARALY